MNPLCRRNQCFSFFPETFKMASRRIAQNVLAQSMRLSIAQKQLTVVSAARPGFLLNKAVFATSLSNQFLFKRYLNSNAQGSSIFKVIDYNDIQSIIKNEGKVRVISVFQKRLIFDPSIRVGLSFD